MSSETTTEDLLEGADLRTEFLEQGRLVSDLNRELASLQDELKRVNALLTARTTEAASAATELVAKPEPIGVWLKVHNLRRAINHPDETDRKRMVAAYMGDFTADDIIALQDSIATAQPLPNPPALTASVDDYNTALEEVRRLREALGPFANMLPDTQEPKDALQRKLQEWCRAARTALTQ